MKKLMLTIILLSVFVISNAQADENIILSTDDVQKNELIITPEIEETVVMWLKNLPESDYSNYGIKNKAPLENLHTGKPIPWYKIVSNKLDFVSFWNVSHISDGETLSLRFTNTWNVPVMSDEEPLLFGLIRSSDFGGDSYIHGSNINNTIEHFHNYEYKDLVIGSVGVNPLSSGMDYLIIRKEHKDIFVQVFDETTGEYFKNEYSFSELIDHLKVLDLREKAKQNRYYDKVADKSELKLTPEITEMLISRAYSSHINDSDEMLSNWGIKDRAQLENLHLGKPIPVYSIVNKKLTFSGRWNVPVMSGGEPLFMTLVKLEDNGQYVDAGGSGGVAEVIHNYEHKDLIIGFLGIRSIFGYDYLIIRKEDKDIFVKWYDWETHETFKTEYSLSDIINLFKK